MCEVRFTNAHSCRVFVAYMRHDPVCADDNGEPWDVLGWVGLSPGETRARENPTGNRWFYYYAEATDGTLWAGDYVAAVRQKRFTGCLAELQAAAGPRALHVGMRELDLCRFGGVTFRP